METQSPSIRQQLRRAMNADRYVARIEYVATSGERTNRVISPVRMTGKNTVLALCLGRGEPRQFSINRIMSIELQKSSDVLASEERVGAFAN